MFKIRDNNHPIVTKAQNHYRKNRTSKRSTKRVSSVSGARNDALGMTGGSVGGMLRYGAEQMFWAGAARVTAAQRLAGLRRDAAAQTQSANRALASRVASGKYLSKNDNVQTQSRTRNSFYFAPPPAKNIRNTTPINMFTFGEDTPSQRLARQKRR